MSQPSELRGSQSRLYWVGASLLAFTALLIVGPFQYHGPNVEISTVPARFTDLSPVRQPTLQPSYRSGAFTYRCNDCHSIIPTSASGRTRVAIQHREIQLEHGINTHCLNCHHPTNRNAFADSQGGEISWSEPQLLCAKCHGPVYRDWQHGSHGRINGYWDVELGEQTRRKCIECHDPHRPPFPALSPAPGPHTLRMGERREAAHAKTGNPLSISGDRDDAAGSSTHREDNER